MKVYFRAALFLLFLSHTACHSHGDLGEKHISQDDFGAQWPFSVKEGIIRCVQFHAEDTATSIIQGIVFVANNQIYAMNRQANFWGRNHGFVDIDDIVLDDTVRIKALDSTGRFSDLAKIKMDITPVLNEGLKLCR